MSERGDSPHEPHEPAAQRADPTGEGSKIWLVVAAVVATLLVLAGMWLVWKLTT